MSDKKRVSFNRSITVKEFNLKHQVNDDQHTDLYHAPMDLTGSSIDMTTSEDMDITEVITGHAETLFNCEDTIMKGCSDDNANEKNFNANESCDLIMNNSLLGTLGIKNMTVVENVSMGRVQKQETARRQNTRSVNDCSGSTSSNIKNLTVLENAFLRNVQEQEPVRRQSPRLEKRASAENEKQKVVKEAIEISKSMTTQKLKPSLTGSTESVSEDVNVTPKIQKMVITTRQSSRLSSKKSAAVSDQNQSISQTFVVQNQSSGDHNTRHSDHGSSRKALIPMTNSFTGQNQSLILNSTQNLTLLDVTPQLLHNTPKKLSQTNQSNLISNFNESNIELLEQSLTSHGIQKMANKELNEDAMVKEYMMKNQALDKGIEILKLEDEALDIEISRLKKELSELPDEFTLSIYKEIFGEN